ncbi:hypothetical protein KR038_012136, partial [Drosophila bunnanda]
VTSNNSENTSLIFFFFSKTYSDFEFTNIKCTCFDESFCSFEYCLIKSVNRTYKYASITLKFNQGPANKIKANLAFYKKLNGYKPFLYNVTVDACKLIKNPTSSPVAWFFYGLFLPFSNVNHSCPFDVSTSKRKYIPSLVNQCILQIIIIDKVSISHMNDHLTRVLPFPKGEYGFFSNWYFNEGKKVTINAYGTLK